MSLELWLDICDIKEFLLIYFSCDYGIFKKNKVLVFGSTWTWSCLGFASNGWRLGDGWVDHH